MSVFQKLSNIARPILLWVGLFVCATPAAANTDLVTSRLISDGKFAEARDVLEASNPSKADILFYNGRVLKAKGRHREAVETFRAVLRVTPDHLNARRELAHTLFLTGELDVAEFHFRDLIERDPNDTMRDGYRGFLRVIDRTQPYGASLTATLLPSTNINRGTANTVFDTESGRFIIDRSSQEKSGIGVRLGIGGYVRHSLDQASRVVARASLEGTKFRERDFDTATGTISVAYERLAFQTHLSATPFLRHTWRRDGGDNSAIGLALAGQRKLSDRVSGRVSVAQERRRYPDRPFQDGPYSSGALTLAYLVAPDLILRGTGTLDRHRPGAEHLRYHGLRASLGAEKSWTGGLHTQLSGFYGRRFFDADFPLTDAPRGDTLWGVEAAVYHSKVQYRGFAPRLTCSYENQTSSVAFYEYDALGCRMALTRNF